MAQFAGDARRPTTATSTVLVLKGTPAITWLPVCHRSWTALSGAQLNATANTAGTFVYRHRPNRGRCRHQHDRRHLHPVRHGSLSRRPRDHAVVNKAFVDHRRIFIYDKAAAPGIGRATGVLSEPLGLVQVLYNDTSTLPVDAGSNWSAPLCRLGELHHCAAGNVFWSSTGRAGRDDRGRAAHVRRSANLATVTAPAAIRCRPTASFTTAAPARRQGGSHTVTASTAAIPTMRRRSPAARSS
jgi:hypothetical protein